MDRTTSSETDALEGIRRLLDATIVATFVLIVLGGVVRVSDSGLGCGPEGSGTQGWPLCGGRLLPFLQEHQVIEFSHRLVATVVVVLIAALVFQALRHHRERHWLVRGTVAAAVLVLAQAALGGLTVEHGLHSALVAAHLGLAMLLLALLIVLRRITRPEPEAPAAGGSRARASAATTTVLLLATIVAGGYVAGTEGEGTPDQPALGAHLACGEQFPTCLNKFMPFEYGRLVDIQLTHRLFMYLTTIAAVIMCALAWRRRAPSRAFAVIPFLLAAQILLGAMNVWMGEHPWLIVSHLTLATALWATVVYAAASLIAVPASATRRRERPSPIRHATSG